MRERYPKIPRRVSGYNLDDLLPENGFHIARALAGTEGTCVTLLSATVHLIESPPCRTLVVAGYEDAAVAADHVPDVLEHRPTGLEGVDEQLIEDMTMLGLHQHDLSLLPDGRGWLVIEVGGQTKEEADEKGQTIIAALEKAGGGLKGTKLYDDPPSEEHIWKVREAGLGATAFLPGKPDTHEGWEDSAVPPERLGDYLRKLKELTGRYGYASALYGHLSFGTVDAATCTPASTSTSRAPRASPPGGGSWTRQPTSCSRSAARCRASMATDSRAPSCSRRCSGTSWSEPSASSRRSGIPTAR